jgi:hypothetical protein
LSTRSSWQRHGLTVCDALHLQLALDVDGELALLNVVLCRTATAEGVAVLTPG